MRTLDLYEKLDVCMLILSVVLAAANDAVPAPCP
jgi:hypothetical protein